jgi:orotate phosphoribosyltransferase
MGSPLLGYKFSELLDKPFVLHSIESKFQSKTDNLKQVFDIGKTIPSKGSTALLVDDSTTGGRKMIKAIEDLRKYGYKVTDCLVIFEPTIKNVRERLKDKGITLHSITKIGADFIEG